MAQLVTTAAGAALTGSLKRPARRNRVGWRAAPLFAHQAKIEASLGLAAITGFCKGQ